MPICCVYREGASGVAVACYDGKDECPTFPGLNLVSSEEVASCKDCLDKNKGLFTARRGVLPGRPRVQMAVARGSTVRGSGALVVSRRPRLGGS